MPDIMSETGGIDVGGEARAGVTSTIEGKTEQEDMNGE